MHAVFAIMGPLWYLCLLLAIITAGIYIICSIPRRRRLGIILTVIGAFLLWVQGIPSMPRARSTAQKNSCIAHLKQFESAKKEWAQQYGKVTGDKPTEDELVAGKFIKIGYKCPAGGTYDYGGIGTAPRCTIPGHTL